MYELLWTLLGVALALVVTRLRRPAAAAPPAQTNAPTEAPAEAPSEAPAEPTVVLQPEPAPPPIVHQPMTPPDARRLARSLAEELANLVSGVEGRAHHLIEAAPTHTQLPSAAEAMLASVNRLHNLHTKLTAVGHGRTAEAGTTDVAKLIAGLGDELQHMQLGLELNWEPPPNLPAIDACPVAMRDALLCVCSALLRAERGATRLSFVAERSFADVRPTLNIEVTLEWISASHRVDLEELSHSTFTLDLEAATHLIGNYDGELTLSHLPGKSVCAVIRMPMLIPADSTIEAPSEAPVEEVPAEAVPADEQVPPVSVETHRFGGALVLESDPALRAVLSRELKASGRAVFACADGVSAHTFLEATPDRFELLILDDEQQLIDDAPLARTIREHAPSLKICLLTPNPMTSANHWPAAHWLRKPFGVHELRRTLASILTAG